MRNDIPNLELPIKPTDKLIKSLELAKSRWEFIGHFFSVATEDRKFTPALMPIISLLTLTTDIIPTVDRLGAIIKPYCNWSNPEPRIYSCWTAWLRELDCAVRLAALGTVAKPLLLDLTAGVDLIFRPSTGGEFRIGIAHRGDRYLDRKRRTGITYLLATGAHGLHVVSQSEIDSKLRQ